MRDIDLIVVHCSATPNGDDRIKITDPDERWSIDDWHGKRGFNRKEADRLAFNPELHHIGYHGLIHVDGSWHSGRAPHERGAHARGENNRSLGVCLVGGLDGGWDGEPVGKYTLAQWRTLNRVVNEWAPLYNVEDIVGHSDLPGTTKTCPNFSIDDWLRGGSVALMGHIF